MALHPAPTQIELIGEFLTLLWPDGREDFLDAELLRLHSPSAENQGEVDILGIRHGGDDRIRHRGVSISHFNRVGNYAIQIVFSDGHRTGLYSWNLLRQIGDLPKLDPIED
ncbi:MAG: gamma-butyrobetaine hydroxylase-like domain-containing protein [Puniceicoccaceae bacterium]